MTLKQLPVFAVITCLLACNVQQAARPEAGKPGSSSDAATTEPKEIFSKKRKLVWSDEFDGNGAPDPKKWAYDIGGQGWGNNELQYYTNRMDNAERVAGKLVITARKDGYENRDYTSARLVTRDRQTWKHVRVEVNAKLPSGRGTWPAIWMLGENIGEVSWPDCGEIDIMEHVGYAPDSLYGTVHTKAFNHVIGTQVGDQTSRPDLETAFHTYFIDWTENKIDFGIDEEVYFTFNKVADATQAEWPFDTPHYLLLNVAVGGNWGGVKGVDERIFPQTMEVDWVRIYQ
ncbi:glycoside hydrolase [Lewinellaceae bacterium SD302]|nr:glycoside hydrolase [Lewinellaceae bacterium SD302]